MPPLWLIARAAASTPAKICGRLSIGVPMGADVATLIGAAVKVGAASAGDEAGELPAEPAQADRVTNRLTSPAALASEHHRLCTGSALVGFLILILPWSTFQAVSACVSDQRAGNVPGFHRTARELATPGR